MGKGEMRPGQLAIGKIEELLFDFGIIQVFIRTGLLSPEADTRTILKLVKSAESIFLQNPVYGQASLAAERLTGKLQYFFFTVFSAVRTGLNLLL